MRFAPIATAFFVIALSSPLPAAEIPQRIVSIGGATTEIVYELGLGASVVAVDSTSQHPDAVRARPNVGYMRALAAEPIIALSPDLVLLDGDSGPRSTIDQLREAGLRLVIVPDKPTVSGVLRKIAVIAKATGSGHRAATRLRKNIVRRLEQVSDAVAQLSHRPKVLFLLSVGSGGAPLAGGRETSADGIIGLAGGLNAATAFSGFKPITPEAIVETAPDVVLVTRRSLGMLGGKETLLANPAIAATPAGRSRRIVAMDGLLLLGFGPRIGDAVLELARALHPQSRILPGDETGGAAGSSVSKVP